MTDERRVDREGIHIDRDLADEIAIEEELDSNVMGAYKFPSPERRLLAGWVSLALGVVAWVTIPHGWAVAVGFASIGVWQFVSAWPLRIDEHDALHIAGGAVDFPVGHASAAVRFHGWRSKPRWAVILYAATEPPDERALVVVDALAGEVLEVYSEAIEAI